MLCPLSGTYGTINNKAVNEKGTIHDAARNPKQEFRNIAKEPAKDTSTWNPKQEFQNIVRDTAARHTRQDFRNIATVVPAIEHARKYVEKGNKTLRTKNESKRMQYCAWGSVVPR